MSEQRLKAWVCAGTILVVGALPSSSEADDFGELCLSATANGFVERQDGSLGRVGGRHVRYRVCRSRGGPCQGFIWLTWVDPATGRSVHQRLFETTCTIGTPTLDGDTVAATGSRTDRYSGEWWVQRNTWRWSATEDQFVPLGSELLEHHPGEAP